MGIFRKKKNYVCRNWEETYRPYTYFYLVKSVKAHNEVFEELIVLMTSIDREKLRDTMALYCAQEIYGSRIQKKFDNIGSCYYAYDVLRIREQALEDYLKVGVSCICFDDDDENEFVYVGGGKLECFLETLDMVVEECPKNLKLFKKRLKLVVEDI